MSPCTQQDRADIEFSLNIVAFQICGDEQTYRVKQVDKTRVYLCLMGMLLNAIFLVQRVFHKRFHMRGLSSLIVCFPAFQRWILELSSHGFGIRECGGGCRRK